MDDPRSEGSTSLNLNLRLNLNLSLNLNIYSLSPEVQCLRYRKLQECTTNPPKVIMGSGGFVFARKGEQLLGSDLRAQGRYALLEEGKCAE